MLDSNSSLFLSMSSSVLGYNIENHLIPLYARHIFSNKHLKDEYFPDFPQPPLPSHPYNLTLDFYNTDIVIDTINRPLVRRDFVKFLSHYPEPSFVELYLAHKITCSPYHFPNGVDFSGFVFSNQTSPNSIWGNDPVYKTLNNNQGYVNSCSVYRISENSIEFNPLSSYTLKQHTQDTQAYQLDHITVSTSDSNSTVFYNPSFTVEYIRILFRVRRLDR